MKPFSIPILCPQCLKFAIWVSHVFRFAFVDVRVGRLSPNLQTISRLAMWSEDGRPLMGVNSAPGDLDAHPGAPGQLMRDQRSRGESLPRNGPSVREHTGSGRPILSSGADQAFSSRENFQDANHVQTTPSMDDRCDPHHMESLPMPSAGGAQKVRSSIPGKPVDGSKSSDSSVWRGHLRNQKSVFRYWRLEICASLFVILPFIAIIATLYPHEHKPLPEWPYRISVNALLSI